MDRCAAPRRDHMAWHDPQRSPTAVRAVDRSSGGPDAPAPAPPDAAATPDAASPSLSPSTRPSTEEPPRITHQSPPIFPDVPRARQKPTEVVIHVEGDAGGSPANPRVISPPNPPFDDLALPGGGS